jgi:hypothetical protein
MLVGRRRHDSSRALIQGEKLVGLRFAGAHNAVLADPFRIVAGNHVDQADDIQRVLPVDDEKG